jgi:hypothetical protein
MDEQANGPGARGDAEARFAEACRILEMSAPQPEDVRRAVGLLEAASEGGNSGASEVLALFEAMGIVAPKNWKRSFDLLALAAAQGSESARRQLLLLATPGRPPDISGDVDWKALTATISIDRLLGSPARIALSARPRIRVIEGFATIHECNWLIERVRPRLARALIFDETGAQIVDDNRSNTGALFNVLQMDVVLEVLRNRIAAATRVPIALFEPTQILHYAVGEQFAPHYDFFDPENDSHRADLNLGQRIATFLVYLNDAFEGGETEFPSVGIRYRGRAGDAVFWANVDDQGRPDELSYHAGLPPLSGEKWILSQWIRDRMGVGPAT